MELPPPWEIRESMKHPGHCYYYNTITNESTWIRPIPYPGHHVDIWPPTIFVAHILLKHTLVRDISGPRGPATRTIDSAKQLIASIIDKLVKNEEPFEEVARTYSDDSSFENGGIVGWIKRGQRPKKYDEAAWQLKIGEMSSMVQTDEGIYLILRRG